MLDIFLRHLISLPLLPLLRCTTACSAAPTARYVARLQSVACATHAIRYDAIIPLSDDEDGGQQGGGGEGEGGGGDRASAQQRIWRHRVLDGPLRAVARRMNLSTVLELRHWLAGSEERPRGEQQQQREGQGHGDVLRHYSKVQTLREAFVPSLSF